MIDPKRKKTSKHIQQPEKNWLKKIEVGFFFRIFDNLLSKDFLECIFSASSYLLELNSDLELVSTYFFLENFPYKVLRVDQI